MKQRLVGVFIALGTIVFITVVISTSYLLLLPAPQKTPEENQSVHAVDTILRGSATARDVRSRETAKTPSRPPALAERPGAAGSDLFDQLNAADGAPISPSNRTPPMSSYFGQVDTSMAVFPAWAVKTNQQESVFGSARSHLMMDALNARPFSVASATTATLAASLNTYLDATERVLDQESWKTPAFEDYASIGRVPHSFLRFGWLAAARASLRGENERAARLFERYLEAARIMRVQSFPYPFSAQVAQNAMFQVCSLPSFPVEGIRRAQKAIDAAELTPEQMKGLADADYVRFRDSFLTTSFSGPIRRGLPRKSYMWREVFGGRGEQAVARALDPVWCRQIDEYRTSRLNGDSEGASRAWIRLRRTLALMNVDTSLGYSPMVEVEQVLRNTRIFPWESRFDRFIMAACRYKRDKGRYPSSARELVPGYLDASFVTSGTTWSVYVLPPMRIPGPESMVRSKALRDAAEAYQRKYRHQVQTPEQLKEFAASPAALAEIESEFEQLPETPVFCRSGFSGDGGYDARYLECRIPRTSPSFQRLLRLLDVGTGEKKKINVQRNGRGDTIVAGENQKPADAISR